MNSAQVRDWENRLLTNDPKVRAKAEADLVQGSGRSLPLLRRFLNRPNEDLHLVTFQIIRRIGPPAIPLLVDLFRDKRVSIRRSAVDPLIDLAPETEIFQPALRGALRDEDPQVAGDAARALGALGQKASPSVLALVRTLSHEDAYVRIYAAEALASIGPDAAAATVDLAKALDDPIPGVRWAACEALATIGPAAQSAVPQLIEALTDEFLYVRIFAAGALGSIGPKARTAREALTAAANDPALRDEAEYPHGPGLAADLVAGITGLNFDLRGAHFGAGDEGVIAERRLLRPYGRGGEKQGSNDRGAHFGGCIQKWRESGCKLDHRRDLVKAGFLRFSPGIQPAFRSLKRRSAIAAALKIARALFRVSFHSRRPIESATTPAPASM